MCSGLEYEWQNSVEILGGMDPLSPAPFVVVMKIHSK